MEVKHVYDASKGYFVMMDGVHEAGRMTYSIAGPTKIIVDHTEVNEQYAGQGIGLKLLDEVVDYARQQHIQIVPLCPFAKASLHKYDKYKDML
jgi:predicted GNAT family acetyltransferase